MKSASLPWFAVEFRKWGKPQVVARRLDCPVSAILAVMNGDERAFRSLTDGSASRSGRKLFLYPIVFHEVDALERRKRPRGMSIPMWRKIVSIFPVSADKVAE